MTSKTKIYYICLVNDLPIFNGLPKKRPGFSVLAALLLVLMTAGWGASTNNTGNDCDACNKLQSEIEVHKAEEDKATVQLEHQRAELKALPVENSSSRMKLTSGIFVRVAQVETAQNKIMAKEAEVLKLNCHTCSSR